MSEQTSLFLKTYRNGSHVIVAAPGSLAPIPSKQMTVDFPQTLPPPPDRPVSDEQQKDFMILLDDNKLMRCDYFSHDQISQAARGVVPADFQITRFIPLSCGGSDKIGNCVLMENRALPVFQNIWRQIADKLTTLRDTGIQLQITLPTAAPIITLDHLERWLESNQEIQQKEQNRHKTSERITTRIHQEIQPDGSLFIWFTDHSFVNQPTVTFTLSDPLPNGREKFAQNENLHKGIRRRDASLLKNLGNDEIYRIKKRGQLPDRLKLQMHHVQPLSWGGQNTRDNICLVQPEVHVRFNTEIENPLDNFLANMDLHRQVVRVCLPVPLQAYHHFPMLQDLQTNQTRTAPPPSPRKINAEKRKAENRKKRRNDKRLLEREWQYC